MNENGGLRLAQTAVGQCNCGYERHNQHYPTAAKPRLLLSTKLSTPAFSKRAMCFLK
jgi:hypothetical protein